MYTIISIYLHTEREREKHTYIHSYIPYVNMYVSLRIHTIAHFYLAFIFECGTPAKLKSN